MLGKGDDPKKAPMKGLSGATDTEKQPTTLIKTQNPTPETIATVGRNCTNTLVLQALSVPHDQAPTNHERRYLECAAPH